MKKALVVLIFLLVVSIGTNIYFLNEKNQEYSIEGTFIYDKNVYPGEEIYFVFTDEGKYIFYQQGDKCIDEGKYSLKGEEILLVSSKDNKEREAVFINDSLICNIGDDVIKAERNSDVPTYINYDRGE